MGTLGYHYRPVEEMGQTEMHKLKASTQQLVAARQALGAALNKTRELGVALDKSEHNLRTISGRLPPLEKAMAPLLVQTASARCLASQIEDAVAPAKAVLQRFQELRALEVALMREPKENLDAYLAAIHQLNACVQYIQENSGVGSKLLQDAVDTVLVQQDVAADKARARRLTEALSALKQAQRATAGDSNASVDGGLLGVALERLTKEFKRIMVEHTLPLTLPDRVEAPPKNLTAPPPAKDDPTEQILLPPAVLKRLYVIMSTLTANGGLEKCVEAYREIRSTRAFVSLQGLKLDYLKTSNPEALEKMDWDDLQTMIGLWSEHIEVAVKVLYASERRLCEQVLGRIGQGAYVGECMYKVARIGMLQFLSFGEGVARSHRAPEKLFKLLDMFEALDKCMPSVKTVFDGDSCLELRSQVRELQKMVVSQACHTFWEFKQWVVEQREGTMAPDGGVTRLSSYVVNYLKYLVSDFYSPIMDKVLKIEQNWRGQGRPEERGLAHGVLLFMQALERQVEVRSNEYSDYALRHIFMMNNLWYMRTRAKKCELGPLLGEQWLTEQRRKVEQHALAYEHEVWGGVLKHLTREGLNVQGAMRSAVREPVLKRLRDFSAAFDSACQRHLKWVIAEEDLREGTREAIVQAVVPSYRSFIHTFGPLFDNGSGPKSFYKYTPESIEHMITELLHNRLELPRMNGTGHTGSAGHGGHAHGRQPHVAYANQPPYRERSI